MSFQLCTHMKNQQLDTAAITPNESPNQLNLITVSKHQWDEMVENWHIAIKEINELKTKVEKLEGEKASLKKRIEKLEDENASLRAENKDLKTDIKNIKDGLNTIETQMDSIKSLKRNIGLETIKEDNLLDGKIEKVLSSFFHFL